MYKRLFIHKTMGASFIALCGFLPTIEQRFTKLSDSLLGFETKAQHKVVLTMSQQAVGEGLVHTSPSGVSKRRLHAEPIQSGAFGVTVSSTLS